MEYSRRTFSQLKEGRGPSLPASGRRSSGAPGHWGTSAEAACPGSGWSSVAFSGRPRCRSRGHAESWWSYFVNSQQLWDLTDHDDLKQKHLIPSRLETTRLFIVWDRNESKEGLCSMSIPHFCSSYSNNIEKPLGPSWEDAGNGAQLSVITPPSQARLRDSFHAFQHFWSLLCGFTQIVRIATATFCHGLISKYIWPKNMTSLKGPGR